MSNVKFVKMTPKVCSAVHRSVLEPVEPARFSEEAAAWGASARGGGSQMPDSKV